MTITLNRFTFELCRSWFYLRIPHVGECFIGRDGEVVWSRWQATGAVPRP